MQKSSAVIACFAALSLPCPAGAQDALDDRLSVRGLSIAAPDPRGVDEFVRFIDEQLAPRRVNTLVLRVDYRFQYASRPEMADDGGLTKHDAAKLSAACRRHGIRLIPQINLLGHQSWSNRVGRLLAVYPQFDETPWVTMPERHRWPNADGLYCKSYCPRHPDVHAVVFALVDELCDAFEADAFHAGMDEVFYIAEDKCPRCGGADPAEVFADEVTLIHDHLHARGRELWIWGDRLIDGDATGLGQWEASTNGTHDAIDRIPRDVVICDWHYDRPDPTAVHFAMHGLNVVSCPWKKADVAVKQLRDMLELRADSSDAMRPRFCGVMQTVWSGADSFLRELARDPSEIDAESEGHCFRTLYAEIYSRSGQDAAPRRQAD